MMHVLVTWRDIQLVLLSHLVCLGLLLSPGSEVLWHRLSWVTPSIFTWRDAAADREKAATAH